MPNAIKQSETLRVRRGSRFSAFDGMQQGRTLHTVLSCRFS
jgi:hypothetical protein